MNNYVYQLKFKNTEQLYIGARKCTIDPMFDLWVKYFSSSKVIKHLIKLNGKDSFEINILKTFNTFDEALDFELELLESVGADKNDLYLNQSIPNKTFRSKIRLPATNEKIRKALTGRPNPRKGTKGKPCSLETKAKLSRAMTGRAPRDVWKNKLDSEPQVTWVNTVTKEIFVGNRRELKKHDDSLYVPELGWVISGKSKSHKGWIVKPI
jgi:hypothetical protein